MDVSSGEEHEEHPKAAHAHHQQKHKKKHLTEDEMEAAMAAKGASKAREWLDSGFGGFKKVGGSLHCIHREDLCVVPVPLTLDTLIVLTHA